MTTAPFERFNHAQMRVERDSYLDDDLYDYHEEDEDIEEPQQYCCTGCMDCLGLSWRDFM